MEKYNDYDLIKHCSLYIHHYLRLFDRVKDLSNFNSPFKDIDSELDLKLFDILTDLFQIFGPKLPMTIDLDTDQIKISYKENLMTIKNEETKRVIAELNDIADENKPFMMFLYFHRNGLYHCRHHVDLTSTLHDSGKLFSVQITLNSSDLHWFKSKEIEQLKRFETHNLGFETSEVKLGLDMHYLHEICLRVGKAYLILIDDLLLSFNDYKDFLLNLKLRLSNTIQE